MCSSEVLNWSMVTGKYTEICWISCWTGVFMARIVGDLYSFSFLVLSLFWLSTKSHNKLTSQQPRVKFVKQFNPTVPVFGAGLQHKHRTSVSFQSACSVCGLYGLQWLMSTWQPAMYRRRTATTPSVVCHNSNATLCSGVTSRAIQQQRGS